MPKVASLIAFNDDRFFLAAATWPEVFANRADEPVALDGDVNAMLVSDKDSSRSKEGMVAVIIMLCKC